MTARRAFIDSNVLLYLLSADTAKADRAEAVVQAGGRISVQVLNEITNVARRKLAMPWPEVSEVVRLIQSLCPVEPLTVETHEKGRQIAERYGFSVYDAMIIAAALLSDCEILYSEDMQDGMLIEEGLRVRNPFAAGLSLGTA
ncbi:PIN domain-containing protein [Cupriavidus sp. YAF13]|uniref:PIN domain-containing protein n=1 Tax=Cupriavidus sp. YAF13 TaxID=3233075 RepID=UPI003F915C18